MLDTTLSMQTIDYNCGGLTHFFSDYKQTGADTSCVAAQTMVSLNDIFLQIAAT